MKLDIMLKNENEFIENLSLGEIFNRGIYNESNEFNVIKTLFKEVKIIRPLMISKTKQIDVLPDTSFLQIKIENKTSSVNFIDNNLKNSKFLTGDPALTNSRVLNYGISLMIKDIQVLNEETIMDRKTTINLKNLEQNINKESPIIPLNNVHFTLMNKQLPIELKPGEEIVLILKVHKSAYISEKSLGVNSTDTNTGPNSNTLEEMEFKLANCKPHSSILNHPLSSSNLNTNSNLFNQDERASVISVSTNYRQFHNTRSNIGNISNMNNYSSNNNNSITSKIKIYENSSIYNQDFKLPRRRKNSFSSVSTITTNVNNNTVLHNYNYENFANQVHENGKELAGELSSTLKSPINNKLEESNIYIDEEIIKVILSTPIILDISSDKFYDNLFMTIPIKWHNEISRFLKIEIEFPEKIHLHEYFLIFIKAKNISNNQMDLILEISESSCELLNEGRLETEVFDYKEKG